MKNQFLDAYIHLEKLCNEIYREKHGISKYIEDMECTDEEIPAQIPQWSSTYKKLKELRWKRNQLVHEGNVKYDNADVKWLKSFYQQIVKASDPLSIKYRLQQEKKSNVHVSKKRTNEALKGVGERESINKIRTIEVTLSIVVAIILIVIAMILFELF